MAKQLVECEKGLPNTCSDCGEPIKGKKWFAENEDQAEAGQGVCDKCAKKGGKSRQEPELVQTVPDEQEGGEDDESAENSEQE